MAIETFDSEYSDKKNQLLEWFRRIIKRNVMIKTYFPNRVIFSNNIER